LSGFAGIFLRVPAKIQPRGLRGGPPLRTADPLDYWLSQTPLCQHRVISVGVLFLSWVNRRNLTGRRVPRKAAIMQDVRRAFDQLLVIHETEIDALLHGDFDRLNDLDKRLRAARNRKASLVELYREHVTTHGC
jgi:hypothetical protein